MGEGENNMDWQAHQDGAWKEAPMDGLASTNESKQEKTASKDSTSLQSNQYEEDGEIMRKEPVEVDVQAKYGKKS